MDNPAKQFDYERAMLWGDRLRVLLNSDHISNGEITETLREKGIFIGSGEKSETVPLLSACLLTPNEFTNLVEKSFVRESGKKYSSSKFKLTASDSDWKTEIQNNFESVIEGIKLGDDREFASEPALSVDPDGNVRITYSVRVLDFSKDWINREITYPGEVLLKQADNDLEIEVNKSRTSQDTNKLNDAITGAIGKFYKSKGITTDEKPESILFDDFTNNERIRFFLQLTSVNTAEFSFKEIGNFEIIRDQEAGALPKEERIEWMDGHVNKVQIKGSDLGKIFLLKEESYYQYYYLIKMTATYAFKFGASAGDCGIEFAFSGKTSRDDNYSGTVFDFSIERLPRVEEGSKIRVRKDIIQRTQAAIDAAFKHVKSPAVTDLEGE
ncbi:hypothetical protein [Thiopseudomonas denitrificans]|uniref:GAPS4b N-terminal domain-containing protein n=1 Tax=Thiopseudomonas denitrificans TaxID=1501432 RepID=A0A4R6U3G5_9GAMM|nr:hypothetical protein [Thiopseudomonas denitrificans]TDQ38955.1 hypothetical protein DFQ45_103122 [Thiopseudomonas denitrificans]